MSDRIVVTPAQVTAAQMQVRLAKELGRTVSPLIRRIADAKPRPTTRPDDAPDADLEPAAQG